VDGVGGGWEPLPEILVGDTRLSFPSIVGAGAASAGRATGGSIGEGSSEWVSGGWVGDGSGFSLCTAGCECPGSVICDTTG
jgi:hypothetical protein